MSKTYPIGSSGSGNANPRHSALGAGSQPFSVREGLRGEYPLIYDDAPDALRHGLLEVLHGLRYRKPTEQRRILCNALRVIPDKSNWSEYPNIENEVLDLIAMKPWYRFYDALERIQLYLPDMQHLTYYKKMNALFDDEQVGYRFEVGNIVRIGTEELHSAVKAARNALQGERFAEPRRQFERGYEFRNGRPPDWPNAIKEAVNSVEAVLQVVYDRPGMALPTIVSQNFPDELPGGIKKMFRSLYSQGSGTVGARHASIGGNEPTGPRAELAIHIAAALHAFTVVELDLRERPSAIGGWGR